ncbi:restriction endonuclease subunit S [Streptococcus suis]|nr:restriction endonuclease subunit S [Streptococcus suis]NQJ44457.1 restriction endonuclease subunit S [Streptococcus suis]NQN07127.1 restriction endonuclease subunit S [Streptococcus suis]NQQ51725.1 restriction endonuclease subunit S [Streptococcus suis]HEM5566357.1 restriction endonuclease subunit S [Streptococcus suis]
MPNKDKNIPKRRFKAFENADAWELRKLKLLFIFKYGDGNNNPSNGGPYPVFGAGGVQGGYTEYNSENSIIIGHMGDAGCVSWGEGKHFVTYNGTITRPKEEVFTAKFGYYLLSKMNLRQYRGGSGLPFLTYDMLNDMDTIVPTNKSECDKISEFFSTLDQQITLHQRKLDKLKNVKQAYLSEMFPAEGERVPKRRFPGFTDAWELRKVGEICSISTGKSNTQDRDEQGKFPFYVRSPIIEKSTKYLFDEEAVLTVGDGVGTGKVFHYVNGKYDLHQRVYRMFSFTHVNAKYFYYYFSKKFFDRVMAMTAKNSVDSVRLEMISDMEITFPQLEEQEKIVKVLSTLDQQITLHQRKLEKLKNLKKALLNELFV